MDKKELAHFIAASAALAVLILCILIYSYFKAQLLWGIIAAGIIVLISVFLLFIFVFTDPLAFSWKSEGRESGVCGVESEAFSDSKVYEKPSIFFGIPFGFVLGGVFSRYWSLFSMEYDGVSAVVLYHGVCLASKGERLIITGKWRPGKKNRGKRECYCC
ncbi:hypothetical protein [Methanosarcina sp. 2.H.A.1B.4]|uniref:hypothetical protein n=1 Tax=Methanosarcina sp. 2.H.A.1B.4 TaxID=1483600 RepID=UPI000696DB41|nr:hypothetical protein [Methanosarcina sp. 2.H.A.1B.4]